MEKEGVYFNKGDHKRLAGKMQFHYRLAFDKMGIPMFYVFRSCRDFIRTIPNLVYDDKHVEDIDTEGEDHCVVGETVVNTLGKGRTIKELIDTV